MIRAVSQKEYVERKPLLAIALVVVLILAASMPFLFAYTIKRAMAAGANEGAQLVLHSLRSYEFFIESSWCARNLSRLLCLLALLAGAGALAGERENRTLPLLYTSSVSLRAVTFVKFGVIATWLMLVTLTSAGVLAAHSLIERLPFPALDVMVASLVAWGNALAFLAVVFAASSLAPRTIFAGIGALIAGFAIAAAVAPLGLNGTALATNVFASDGSVLWPYVGVDLLFSFAVVCLGLLVAMIEVDRRRAT
jgi:ABC-type transport system involved in multi-copper enzyme maturation permease subunit